MHARRLSGSESVSLLSDVKNFLPPDGWIQGEGSGDGNVLPTNWRNTRQSVGGKKGPRGGGRGYVLLPTSQPLRHKGSKVLPNLLGLYPEFVLERNRRELKR